MILRVDIAPEHPLRQVPFEKLRLMVGQVALFEGNETGQILAITVTPNGMHLDVVRVALS